MPFLLQGPYSPTAITLLASCEYYKVFTNARDTNCENKFVPVFQVTPCSWVSHEKGMGCSINSFYFLAINFDPKVGIKITSCKNLLFPYLKNSSIRLIHTPFLNFKFLAYILYLQVYLPYMQGGACSI